MRERLSIVVVGSAGSGKSTLAAGLFGRAMQRGEKVKVVSPTAIANIGGTGIPDDPDEWLADQFSLPLAKRPGLIVADDADLWLPKIPAKGSPWRKLYLTGRHVGCDLLVTCRRPQNLPGDLLSNVDFLYVFALSKADVNGIRRLQEIAPGIQIPTEKYRFTCWQPKTLTGNPRTGRTRPGGGFVLDP